MNTSNILSELHAFISETVQAAVSDALSRQTAPEPKADELDEFMPIQDIFKRKLLSPPTFYERVREGRIELHKMGRKSFIRRGDYQKLFRAANKKAAA